MSTQGTILQRRGMHLPIWPVVALLVAVVATAIGLRPMDDLKNVEPVPAIQETEGFVDATVGLPSGPFHAAGRAHEVVLEAPPAATMPVQRVYPDGFGDTEESSPIFDGRRRKW